MYEWLPTGSCNTYWRRSGEARATGQSNQEPFCRGANCPRPQGATEDERRPHRRCGEYVYLDTGYKTLDYCNRKEFKEYDSESLHPDDLPGPEAQQEGQQAGGEGSGSRQQSQQSLSGGQRDQVSGTTGRSNRGYNTLSKSTDKGRILIVKVSRRGTRSDASRNRLTGAASSTDMNRPPAIRATRNISRREARKIPSDHSSRSSASTTGERHHQSIGESRKSKDRSPLTSSSGNAQRTVTAP
ncbi:hypothetical protein DL98DRAFT_540842 [Cadophora sp. DSE1049]|nr:hypothetical protein DL98DRAFT_540842 [Cadophora sp. DSE1049]